MRLSIRKGDLVEVISGEDKGRQGKVLKVDKDKGRVLVDGINMVKKHQRTKGKANQPGGIIDKPSFIDRSNVGLVCPKCGKPSRMGHELRGESRVRVCKRCGGETVS
jgi:large subunit ribosomal protein L24